MRSDNHTHQWGACRRPVISAREKEGNQQDQHRRPSGREARPCEADREHHL